jgi:hypothetical protein
MLCRCCSGWKRYHKISQLSGILLVNRLPTHPANRIDELLPHRWSPS